MGSLTGHQLKMIAIVAMLIDHIAWAFVDTQSVLGQVMHFIGRITAPTMCFFIAQGYIHTRSFSRYLMRLAVFALLSQVPFAFFSSGAVALFPLNVIYTLALGLLSLYAYDKIENNALRWVAILLLVALSMPADWGSLAVFFCLVFYIHKDNFREQCTGIGIFTVVTAVAQLSSYIGIGYTLQAALQNSFFQFGIVLCLPLIYLYNGQRGGTPHSRWIFYIFYPLHLLILGILRWLW